MEEIVGNLFKDIKLKCSSTVFSLPTVNASIKVNNQVIITIDTFILYQRMLVPKQNDEDLSEYFKYEIAQYQLSLFTETGMRKTKKFLYDIFQTVPENVLILNNIFVVDSGFLLHQVKWQSHTSYRDICIVYVNYIKK